MSTAKVDNRIHEGGATWIADTYAGLLYGASVVICGHDNIYLFPIG